MRHSLILLSLCVLTQFSLVGGVKSHRVRQAPSSRHPRMEGISLLVDRIADSRYGLFDPVESDVMPAPTPLPGMPVPPAPEPWMNPEWNVPPPPRLDNNALPPEEIRHLIELEAARNHVDPLLIEAMVRNESGFNAAAVSRTGAQGLMQLMPDTARLVGVSDPFDPAQNIAGGSLYLSWQLQNFGGDVSLALAAYNAGPAAVQRWGGVPPYQETTEYVRRVIEDYRALQMRPASPASLETAPQPRAN